VGRACPWLVPLRRLAGRPRRPGVSVNVGSFLGHGTLREYAKGYELGEATPDEVATMRRVLAEAMEDGAFGWRPR
jgi:N-acyl-D-aspartate/D-glutamate deacylase